MAAEDGIILSAPLNPSSESFSGSSWSLPTLFACRHQMAVSKLGIRELDPTHELMPTTAPRRKEWMCWWQI